MGNIGILILEIHTKTIRSKKVSYRNKIYPEVTDYAYDESFIVAEQRPSKEAFISSLGSDFLERYETYLMYKKNPGILNDPFYSKLRGVVEKDSLLYKLFIERGAAKDSSNTLSIAILMAQSLIENDPYYLNIFSKKVVYWVIYHPADTMIGPLTQKEYLSKKSILGIPDKLRLKFEH